MLSHNSSHNDAGKRHLSSTSMIVRLLTVTVILGMASFSQAQQDPAPETKQAKPAEKPAEKAAKPDQPDKTPKPPTPAKPTPPEPKKEPTPPTPAPDDADLQKQLAEQKKLVTQLTATNKQQAATIAQLQKQLTNQTKLLETSTAKEKTQAATIANQAKQLTEQKKAFDDLTAKAKTETDKAATLQQQVTTLTTEKKTLTDEIAKNTTTIADLQKTIASAGTQQVQELKTRQQLVGLNGEMKRVAILFDCSASMALKEWGGRWEESCGVVKDWVTNMRFDQSVLVTFSRGAKAFPEDGKLLELRKPDGTEIPAGRDQLLGQLDTITPEGGTNTYSALETAFKYEDIDTVLLFTDGAPNNGNTAVFDPAEAKKIYALCEKFKERKIPINTIGLGMYYKDKQLGEFLKKVSENTGGAFIGR